MNNLDARIGDENIDLTEAVEGLLNTAVDRVLIGHIHFDGQGLVRTSKFPRSLFCGFEPDVRDDNAPAGFDEALCNAMPDATCCASHDGDFSTEVHDGLQYLSVNHI